MRKLLLYLPRCPSFKSLYQLAYRLRRWVLDMHVHVVFTDNSFKYPHVLCVAYLDDEFATSLLHVPLQHVIAVLRHPYQMHRQPRDAVASVPIPLHRSTLAASHS